MAVPFRKTSKSKKGKRRSHQALTAPTLAKCSNCGAMIKPHRVCPECGFYNEITEQLSIKPHGIYLDGTLGLGGHSLEILKRLNNQGLLIAFDLDKKAIEMATNKFRVAGYDNFKIINDNYANVKAQLDKLEITSLDGVLVDLGVSSMQLDDGSRGFSYHQDAKLDMRMNQDSNLSAYEVVNEYDENSLSRIFWLYGEETFAKRIAAMIVRTESKAKNRIILGKELTKGLGAGANPNTGREASIESEEEIREALKGADMIFIAAGMGGGTGTGSAPVIAKIAKDLGALTMAIVTRPFTFEGTTRMANANQGLQELKENVDSLIVVSNDKLLEAIGNIPLKSAFQEADKVLRQGVQTITDLIAIPSLINLDFADVRTIMQDKGYALIGIGMEKGENKAEGAALKAISSPLLEASITGAKDAIVNVTGSESMTLFEANAAVEVIREHAGSDINIIFGVAINEELDDQMIVTVIATGFDEEAIIYADPNAIAQRRTE
uniref:Cell division protein FtsZ n=1 Tax=Biomphalaria glabrata TaxID=6526 RepID=A0A2C9JR59_BIOGL